MEVYPCHGLNRERSQEGERRASYLVPRSYVLYYDQEELFGTEEPNQETLLSVVKTPKTPENEPLTTVNSTFKGTPYSVVS